MSKNKTLNKITLLILLSLLFCVFCGCNSRYYDPKQNNQFNLTFKSMAKATLGMNIKFEDIEIVKQKSQYDCKIMLPAKYAYISKGGLFFDALSLYNSMNPYHVIFNKDSITFKVDAPKTVNGVTIDSDWVSYWYSARNEINSDVINLNELVNNINDINYVKTFFGIKPEQPLMSIFKNTIEVAFRFNSALTYSQASETLRNVFDSEKVTINRYLVKPINENEILLSSIFMDPLFQIEDVLNYNQTIVHKLLKSSFFGELDICLDDYVKNMKISSNYILGFTAEIETSKLTSALIETLTTAISAEAYSAKIIQ